MIDAALRDQSCPRAWSDTPVSATWRAVCLPAPSIPAKSRALELSGGPVHRPGGASGRSAIQPQPAAPSLPSRPPAPHPGARRPRPSGRRDRRSSSWCQRRSGAILSQFFHIDREMDFPAAFPKPPVCAGHHDRLESLSERGREPQARYFGRLLDQVARQHDRYFAHVFLRHFNIIPYCTPYCYTA